MSKTIYQKAALTGLFFLAVWLGFRYFLPLFFPFLLGAGLALGADPLVRFIQDKLKLPRWAATGIAVTVALCLLLAVMVLLAGLLIRELGALSGILPDLTEAVRSGLVLLEDWLLGLADRAPDALRLTLIRGISDLFSGGSALLDRLTQWLVGFASGMLGLIPDGILGLGTTILSSYMISARLPALRQRLRLALQQPRAEKILSALSGLKQAVLGWLKAQLRLSGVTFLISLAGLLLLSVSYAPLWALVIAAVDAVPMLGTGTVLLPWAMVCLLQGRRILALGLAGLYLAAMLTRTALEPRLVGKHLGLDPLMTLAALYVGYRLWGIGGMILSPLLAVTVSQLLRSVRTE